MVRPVESIRKDLNGLEGATATLAEEFSQIYATYLTVLGQTVRRQVVMATYHLCTQVYPEEFLALTVSDRGRLQQGMQTLGHKAQGWLQQLMEPDSSPAEPNLDRDDLSRLETALVALTQPSTDSSDDEVSEQEEQADADEADAEAIEGPVEVAFVEAVEGTIIENSDGDPVSESAETPPPSSENELSSDGEASALDPKQLIQSVLMAAISSDIDDVFRDRPFTGDPLTPTLVAKHHLILEQRIRDVLQRVSRKANRLLRKAQVIPDLPESVLEVASDADMAVPKGRAVPNVLNVLVAMAGDVAAEVDRQQTERDEDDTDGSDEEDEALEGTMTHLAAVQLRLADLELGDVQTALWRSKLRTAVGQLRKLGKQYQRAERELAIAQAEQAWRAVWYDDSSR
ncbi:MULTISPECIES: hypothetical protein [Cyanophyceae]|uniref:hypothetical protein n=1 Tax=Cyanophyceae TaxID=3028117 RepID=UPI0016822A23|nr:MULTISPECIES: hypothetical protein [Cyanophyceae]MBD1916704.1 hypothetical protein [Phormidium sp. FACHB-77]MBD2031774.1 hypothetical protein [Phormidium sp. FACHB-322]MBD2050524.1 hypothetical protein [Leptolyngbya sp. FACHB-60]